ncbi:MAG: PEP-CTERM sorting domain-containing protein [Crocosphaera sp.]|nr:PEP-CTERM sorting domain-containing protein [Crocosphaera sp.]
MQIMPRFLVNSFSFAATATTMLVAGAAQALTVVPTDLNPGDEYRLVFVTDGTRDATSSDISVYNDFVTNDVTGSQLEMDLMAEGLNPDWFAIGSTATVDAIDNTSTTGTGVPVYLITGERVADDYVDLWDGSISRNIDTTPSDDTLTGLISDFDLRVWTGTFDGGVKEPSGTGVLGAFGSAPGLVGQSLFGISLASDPRWYFNRPFGFDQVVLSQRMYGMSSVLSVPVPVVQSTPEPSSLLSFITLGGMLLGTAARRARK